MIREELRRLSTWGEHHRRLLARVMIALALSLVVDAVGAGLVAGSFAAFFGAGDA